MVAGSEYRISGSGFGIFCFSHIVLGFGCGIQGLGFRVVHSRNVHFHGWLIWEAVGMVTFLMGKEGVWGKLLDGERRGLGEIS